MKERCGNPRSDDFPRYGGRGIAVCERWRESFAAFLADVGPRPSPHHTIDRIDNARGYEPGNVRWATPTEQSRNKRSNRPITFRGETLVIAAWAKRLGIARSVLRRRLEIWSVDDALTRPPIPRELRLHASTRALRTAAK
jgi:hypothetical protein